MNLRRFFTCCSLTLFYCIYQAQGSQVDSDQLTFRTTESDVGTNHSTNEEYKKIALMLHQRTFSFKTINLLKVVSSEHPYAKLAVGVDSSEYLKVTPLLKQTAERYAVTHGTRYLQNLKKYEFGEKSRITSCAFKSQYRNQSSLHLVLDCTLQQSSENVIQSSPQIKQSSEQVTFTLRQIKFARTFTTVTLNLYTGAENGQLSTAISSSLKRRAERKSLRYLAVALREKGLSGKYRVIGCRYIGTVVNMRSLSRVVHCSCPLRKPNFFYF